VTIDFRPQLPVRATFPVQQTVRATYREMLERRAKANGVDFVKGVARALTPVAFYEVVMNRIAPGKDQTLILDFANIAEEIVEAFAPYYEATINEPGSWRGPLALVR
jgi:hypothetical protein